VGAVGAACGGTRATLGGITARSEGSVGAVRLLPRHWRRKGSRSFTSRDGRETPGRDVPEEVSHARVAVLGVLTAMGSL